MANPRLLRRKVLADPADPDWSGTQVAPAAGLTFNPAGLERVLIVPVARDAMSAVVAGAVQLQLVGAASVLVPQGDPAVTLVWGAPVEGAATGEALEYDVTGLSRVTVRVVDASAAVGAATVDLYWTPVSS